MGVLTTVGCLEKHPLVWRASGGSPPKSEPSTLLEGAWDLVTTYNWALNAASNPPKWPSRVTPKKSRVTSPGISSHEEPGTCKTTLCH